MMEAIPPQWIGAALLSALAFWIIVILVPFSRILRRTGHAPAWSVLFVIPLVNVVALYIFAFKRWPIDNKTQGT